METYHVNTNNNATGGEAKDNQKPEVKESDLFLSGGFDTFTPENEIPLGAGTPFIDDRKYNPYGRQQTVRRPAMGFWKSLFVAFVPFMYDRYSGITVAETKNFIKKYSILVVVASLLPALLLIMFGGKIFAVLLQMPQLATMKLDLVTLIIYVVVGFISVFIYQLVYRINAWFVRMFAGIVSYAEKADVRDSDMYAISVFSLVPAPVFNLIVSVVFSAVSVNVAASGALGAIMGYSMGISLISYLVIPLIYTAIAMPRMDK